MKSAICNEDLGTTIEVDAAVPLLRINGCNYDSWDIREAELFYNIIECHPRVLTYKQIIERILKKYGVANDLYSDPIHYIRKKKLSLCKLLSKTTGFQKEEIIINVRSVGYRLNAGWQKVDILDSKETHDNQDNVLNLILSDISELRNIIEKTIDLSKKLELIEINISEDNVKLILNHQGYEQSISSLAEKFTDISRSLLNLTGSHPFDGRYIRIVRILETIFSYVTMERQGNNISEETWRMLFERELLSHFQCLIAECISPHISS